MLKKKSALIFLSLALALALALASALALLLIPHSSQSSLPSDSFANAAITPATSFSKFTNGSKYYYTNATAASQTTITVNVNDTWGSRTNPYVINTKEQWQLFINTIATNGTSNTTKQANSTWNASTVYYALGADIDFGGNTIDPVGKDTNGFYANLYGNKHTLRNGKLTCKDSAYGVGGYWCSGIFNVLLAGASVYDLRIDKTMSINAIPEGRHLLVGSVSGWAEVCTICNVVSEMSITLTNTSTTTPFRGDVGGIIGAFWSSSSIGMYKCEYKGTINVQAAGSNIGNQDSLYIGGLAGEIYLTQNVVIDCCAVTGTTIINKNGGVNMGGLLGRVNSASNKVIKITNVIVNANLNLTGTNTSPDVGALIGAGAADLSTTNGTVISDVYIIGGNMPNRLFSINDTQPTAAVCNAVLSNIQTSALTSETIYPTTAAAKVTKNNGASATVTKAQADPQINAIYNLSSIGVTASKLWSGMLIVNRGAGATGGTNTAYNCSASNQNVDLTAPTRTGYTFKGWSFEGYKGTVSGTTGYVTVPASTSGYVDIYAVWELNAFTGSPSAATIDFGDKGVFSAADVSHPATTTNSSYGVNLSYQWFTDKGVKIDGATDKTYTINNPNAGTHTYKVQITATPKDGVSAAKTSDLLPVTLTVRKVGVTLPTAATNLIYNGNVQTGVSTSNSLITLGGQTTGTNAGSYRATASIDSNHCWGATGGTDSSTKNIDWSIGKQTIAVPTITAGASLVYNGANQKPNTSTSNYYDVTNAGGTDVGTYDVYFDLKNTATVKNYKWSSPQGSDESGRYTLTFSITPASITLTAPTFTSASHDGKVYVGQTVADLTITQTTGTHVRTGSSPAVNVEGTYSWGTTTAATPGTTKIEKTTTSLSVLFTPTDTKNYNSATTTVSFTPVQIKIFVRELQIEFLDANGDVVEEYTKNSATLNMETKANVELARSITSSRNINKDPKEVEVDYNTRYTVSNLNNASFGWQMPRGYDFKVYSGVDGNNVGTGPYGENAQTASLINNLTLYVGYAAKQVNYTVVTVLQDLVPTGSTNYPDNTPTKDKVLAHFTPSGEQLGDDVLGTIVKTETLKALSGSKVSFSATPIEGFTRRSSFTSNGVTFVSDDQAKFVVGTENTILITYYERNSYNVTWNFSGGSSTNLSGNPAKERLAYTLKYGQTFTRIPDPDYGTSYHFDAWYTSSACTELASIPETMPAKALVFYAGRTAEVHTLTYSYGEDMLARKLGMDSLPTRYKPTHVNDTGEGIPDYKYTVEQIINNGVIRLTAPSMPGFKFVSWVWFDEEKDPDHLDPQKISTITRTTAADYNLYATWDPITYTVTLNTNGGNRLSTSSVRIVNLSKFPASVGQENYDGEGYIMAERPGYTFIGWTTVNDPDADPVSLHEEYSYLRDGTTLYAQWTPNPVIIRFADGVDEDNFAIEIRSTDMPDDWEWDYFIPSNTENTSVHQFLFKDSVLTIDIIPVAGYEVSSITISGVSFTNHGRFTVRTYEDDIMYINVQLVERRFGITYMFNGGSYTGTTQYARNYTRSEDIQLIGGELVSRVGYDFRGWVLNDPESTETLGNYDENYSVVKGERFGAAPATLYAKWSPARVTMIYRNNYTGSGSNTVPEVTVPIGGRDDIYTGATIELWEPDGGFTPANRELIGWATQPNGDIAYNISYKYEADGDEGRFIPQPVSYTVQGTVDNENVLYAVWRITNVQYLVFEAENNNSTYSDVAADYSGVYLTARPRYSYQQESGLKLNFAWYKVNTATWEKWTEDDLEGLTTEDERNQRLSLIGMYKIPEDAVPVRTSPELTYVSAENQRDTFGGKPATRTQRGLYNVSDGGLYICALTAEGTYFTAGSGLKKSTITMYGQYEVIINKANLPVITLESPDQAKTYNGNLQGLTVKTPDPVGNLWTIDPTKGGYRLADGSQLRVNYTYTNNDTNEEFAKVAGVKDVGSYHVKASFEFIDDLGNYNLPETVYADFDIAQREIKDVTYTIETKPVDGDWTTLGNHFDDNTYTRGEFRIVATPVAATAESGDNNIVGRDEVRIVMFYDGDLDVNGKAINVGNYVAYCDSLEGAQAGNYKLSSEIDSRTFSIIKATHNITIEFKNATSVYNGQFVDMTAADKLVIKENGNAVTLEPIDDDKDIMTLSDGCTLTLTYTVEHTYVDARFEEFADEDLFRGGTHAGEYIINVLFEDDPDNAINFNAIDDVSATLTITQAVFCSDGEHPGLTDAQLNRWTTNEEGETIKNVNGFGDNHSAPYAASATYNPTLVLDGNLFEAKYVVEKQSGNSFNEITLPQNPNAGNKVGIYESGVYRFTAIISYKDVQYSNDYAVIPDQVVEFTILPGEIHHLEVNYTQSEHETALNNFGISAVTYGDSFDFCDVNDQGYFVSITAVYKDKDGNADLNNTEPVDNYKASFLNESGEAFTTFDRATVANDVKIADIDDAPALDAEKGHYKVTVVAYDAERELRIKVRQAKLTYDNIGFDTASDSNIQFNSGNWSYGFTYDGQSRYPALSNSNGAYEFLGVNDEQLTAGKAADTSKKYDIVSSYQYYDSASSQWKPMPVNGFANAGTYSIRVTFKNNNTNYAKLDETKTTLNCSVKISSRKLTTADIQWQYCTNDSFTDDKTKVLQQGANLSYCGQTGYYVKAVYRDLADKTGTKVLPVAEIALSGATVDPNAPKDVVKIADAGKYTIQIKKLQENVTNYEIAGTGITAEVTIDPANVELVWQLTGGVKNLAYNGKDQLSTGLSVHYTADFGDQAKPIYLEVDGGATLKDVGTYTLNARIQSNNYKATNATYTVTIDPLKVTEENTTITWFYDNGTADMKQLTEATDFVMDYIGDTMHIYVKYSVQDGDNSGDDDGLRMAEALSLGNITEAPRNAGDYKLSAGLQGNYDLSDVVKDFTVSKKVVTVNWLDKDTVYTYNGKKQEVRATGVGVGDEDGETVILLSGAEQREARAYTTYAVLMSDYVANYELAGAEADGSVKFEWSIAKLPIEIVWDTDSLVYNKGYALNNWSGKVGNLQKDDEGNEDIVNLTFDIFRGETKVDAMKLAGEYTVKVIDSSNSNYAFDTIAPYTVNVAKATPVVSKVVYTEYADNVTYQNNPRGLRNEKLTWECAIDGEKIDGTLKFKDVGASLATLGMQSFLCTFTPVDKDNYETVDYTQLRLNVLPDVILRVGFDKTAVATTYAVGQPFTKRGVTLYFEYASYYEEIVADGGTNKVEVYGVHTKIDNTANDVDFVIKNIPMSGSRYEFTENDVGEVLIVVYATGPDKQDYRGDIRVNVIAAKPTKLTILNKEELQDPSRKYYVGTTFDKSIVEFYAEYETEESNGTISSDLIDITNPILPLEPGTYKIEFTYFTNTEFKVSDSIKITVSAKESVKIGFSDATLKWTGSPIEVPAVKTDKGEDLPDGVTYSISVTDSTGAPVVMEDEGVYTVVIKFTVNENVYNPIDTITALITVKDIKAMVDTDYLKKPDATRPYNGKTLTRDDYGVQNIRIVERDNDPAVEYERKDITYTINGLPESNISVCEAGTYRFAAKVTVIQHHKTDPSMEGLELTIDIEPYTIVIEKVTNVIDTFAISGWIQGQTKSVISFHSTYGEPEYTFYYADENNSRGGLYGKQLPEEAGVYVAIATVHATQSYGEVTKEVRFTIAKPYINDSDLKDNEGRDIVQVKGDKGVNPSYDLRVEVLDLTSDAIAKVDLKKQVKLAAYDIDIVDASGNKVSNPGEYTVRLLLTAEQRSAKSVKVYSVDEYGVSTEISGATVDEEGYLTFKTSNFNGNFVVSARDAAASTQLYWIIGISVGAVVAIAAIAALIIVVIKKKKEND